MRKTLCSTLALVVLSLSSPAVETQTWEHSTKDDFEKGTLEKLSLRSDGRLLLAPAVKELMDPSVAVIWALAEDSAGNLYAGGGGPGATSTKLYKISPAGSTERLAELEGLGIQAVAIDKGDRVYAATSPDGKVYRVTAGKEPEVFYDPGAKYIWSMAFNSRGELFVATGNEGDIHRVSAGGEGRVFFQTEETNVRSLTIDGDDNVIVGTDPGGLIMRISPAGEGFVLHQANKAEVTAVAVSREGNIYAAAVGDKKPSISVPRSVAPVTPAAPHSATAARASPTASSTSQQQTAPTTAIPQIRAKLTGGSEVYRIEPDGHPRLIWSDKEQIVYALTIDTGGRPILGTGNEGKILRLDNDQCFTRLLKLAPSQITAVHAGTNGRLYAATGNIGKVFAIGPELEPEGHLESEVLDADYFSYWGQLRYRGDPGGGTIALSARSGNLDRPQQNWSKWFDVALSGSGGRIEAPPARFLQYKIVLKAGGSGAAPIAKSVEAAYLNKNVAPVIRKIAATPPNYRFLPQTLTMTKSSNITLPSLNGSNRTSRAKPVSVSSHQTMQKAKGFIGARWLAEDDNDDDLTYKLEIRGVNETEWKLLKDELDSPNLSWDSTAYPDGEYQVRVTVSDKPGNPPGQALTAVLEGESFLIDNTPPEIDGLSASVDGNRLRAAWQVADENTTIKKTEYSLDGGDWLVVEPATRLSDSKKLDYSLTVDGTEQGEHTLAVRATDAFDNQSVAKVVVR